jgi:curli production assembly/transport component CsgG
MNMEYLAVALLSCLVGACGMNQKTESIQGDMPFVEGTPTKTLLQEMPVLINMPTDGEGNPVKITVAVYKFPDVTGQRKQVGLSTAVSQGADVWVIQALMAVANGDWFTVVERASLDSLVKERQLIRSTRELYDDTTGVDALSPMLFAGLILEGGIVGYDTNTTSGGAGARYFGLGVNEQYRTDQVTISLRLVAVQTGEILLTVSATKTIASVSNGADVFRFLDLGTRALEIESGNAANEPVNYAIRTAIEYGVLQMLYEGKEQGLWEWAEPVVAEDKNINIIADSNIPLDEWAKHPILEKQGE